jgi:transcriptional regulator with XRE-family HTH domain
MTGIAAHFGDNLVRCRKRADISQEELGVRASLHRTEISQLERGLRVARIDTLVKLAGSLEVPAENLLAGIT